jgi:exonuclease SbcC
MIPLYLSLAGFLSYRERVELDFTTFDLACIAGANGAGKSTLLDAITWALFGVARKRDDSLIHAAANRAEVQITFAYEQNIYRVLRSKPRDKTAVLEFHIYQNEYPALGRGAAFGNLAALFSAQGAWKPLTERTLRETEARIRQTLRMDYDTFVNASFFLQGKADQFTQQGPGDRKRILSTILGLELWEEYRQGAADRRKGVEAEIYSIEGRLQEIEQEIAEEETRQARLEKLTIEIQVLTRQRVVQESVVENFRKIAASLAQERKMVDTLARQADVAQRNLDELQARLVARCQERASFQERCARREEIQAGWNAWQALRAQLEAWEQVATRFREHEKRREGPRGEMQAARARLEQELQTLQAQQSEVEANVTHIRELESHIQATQQMIAQVEQQQSQRAALEEKLNQARQRQADARAENPRLRAEMDELKARIDRLSQVESATCPLCGQSLSFLEREALVNTLSLQGKELGDRYRANLALLREGEDQVIALETDQSAITRLESELRLYHQRVAQTTSRQDVLQAQRSSWENSGLPRLNEISLALESETYALAARQLLSQIDAELKEIGYDAAAHDAARRLELEKRSADDELRALEKAQAALAPLEREIADLETQVSRLEAEAARLAEEHQNAAVALAAAEAQAPDLHSAEQGLYDLQERENRLRIEIGAAQQLVDVLKSQKVNRVRLKQQREDLARQVSLLKQLERAFGKDGVPALLIEQALPQIESRSNDILERLSGGNMSVRFVTQSAYKDRRREDLRETLDIQISDSAGTRDYEMFSGGEAFRVNFAIRLALSEVLAQRAGARLQTLVIDEGFGSQDSQGRQRLIEAINLVQQDFAKILVITHIDDLKDAFPTRIEVEKTERGSQLRVI